MQKLDPKTDGSTTNIVEQNIEALRGLFPDVFTEGSDEQGLRWKVDLDALREVLGEYAEDQQERYSFNWNGKSLARRIAQTPSTGTLRPCPKESVNWDTTQNLFIEGDNLEVLKLLQKSYHRRVKMIYIDPPYNTGGDFIYPDNFKDNIANYRELTGQLDEGGRRCSNNAETAGRYHTNWLNMMLPRLKLARNLLSDTGVIFVSIDDHEAHDLRLLMDEVFGAENFVSSIAWKKRSSPDARDTIGSVHDWILCYVRSVERIKVAIGKMPLAEERIAAYSNPDSDPRGDWASVDMTGMTGRATKDQYFTVTLPSGRKIRPPEGRSWGLAEKTFHDLRQDNRIWFGKSGDNVPRIKKFLSESDGQVVPSFWDMDDVGSNDEAKKEVNELMGQPDVFDTPKPVRLVERMIEIATKSDSHAIVLDFFAGACTSADAVLRMNAEDGHARRFIMVQLPEPCNEASGAYKAGYKTIADIGKDRIRRVIKKIKAEQAEKTIEAKKRLPGTGDAVPDPDLGFKVFKLDASNIKPWDADFDNLKEALLNAVENIKSDRTESDVLYELLLKFGLDLVVPIEERQIEGRTVYVIGAGALVVCLADSVGLKTVEGIATLKNELKPEVMRVVFKDAGFEDDVVKTNAVQILRQADIEDVKSL